MAVLTEDNSPHSGGERAHVSRCETSSPKVPEKKNCNSHSFQSIIANRRLESFHAVSGAAWFGEELPPLG